MNFCSEKNEGRLSRFMQSLNMAFCPMFKQRSPLTRHGGSRTRAGTSSRSRPGVQDHWSSDRRTFKRRLNTFCLIRSLENSQMSSDQACGFLTRVWGDTCGEVCELTFKAFEFSGGRPNQNRPLKFGTAYPLVIFFDWKPSNFFQKNLFSINWFKGVILIHITLRSKG
jgi:hypothetical protein